MRGSLIAVLLLVAACVPYGKQFESPEVTLETLRILRVANGKAELAIGLRVFNPNTYTLPVDSVEFEVYVDGRPTVTSRSVRVEPLPREAKQRSS